MKTIQILLIAMVASLNMQSSAEIMPYGRSWVYAEYYTGKDGVSRPVYYQVDVVGDTIVNGQQCKHIAKYYIGDEYCIEHYALFETENQVIEYSFNENTNSFEQRIVMDNIQSTELPAMQVHSVQLEPNIAYHYLVECKDNGKVIFTHADYTSSVETAPKHPELFTEGKSWLMGKLKRTIGEKEKSMQVYRVELGGDTVINNLKCTILLQTFLESGKCIKHVAHEQYGVIKMLSTDGVYDGFLSNGEFYNVISFNLKDNNGPLCVFTGEEFYERQTINRNNIHAIDNSPHIEYVIHDWLDNNSILTCWVEGIGESYSNRSITWLTKLPYWTGPTTDEGSVMLECCENGNVIFRSKDFSYPDDNAAITELTVKVSQDSNIIYDIQGRQVKSPVCGRIYIINGKCVGVH